MKKIQMRAASLAARLCGIGLAVIGLSSCDDERVMYGDPYMYFDVNIAGDVTAEADGTPVEGAKMVIKDWSPVSSVLTDADGNYSIDTRNQKDKPSRSSYVACYPPEDSGLEADSVKLEDFEKTSQKSSIEILDAQINFKLKGKK